jgi:hypothetical protein
MVAYKNLPLEYAALALSTYTQKNNNRQLALMTQHRKKAVMRIAKPLANIKTKKSPSLLTSFLFLLCVLSPR